MIALAVAFGLAIGLAVGTMGGGGSVLAVPVLVYLLDQSVPEATTTSLVVVVAASLAGGLGHAREGRVCWRHAGSFTAAAVPGVVVGTLAANEVSADALLAGFGLVMVAAAVATWRKASESSGDDEDGWKQGDTCPPLRMPRDVIAGLAVGALTGFFGVGGGFLIVPTLAIALAFTMRTAVGTSLAIIAGTSLTGLLAHLASGRSLDLPITLAMALACMVGSSAGAALSGRVPQPVLGRAFAAMVTAVAAYLIVSVVALGGAPGS